MSLTNEFLYITPDKPVANAYGAADTDLTFLTFGTPTLQGTGNTELDLSPDTITFVISGVPNDIQVTLRTETLLPRGVHVFDELGIVDEYVNAVNFTGLSVQASYPNPNEVLDVQVAINQDEADKHYTLSFTITTSLVIIHNLNKYPNVSVFDNLNQLVTVDISYDSLNQCTLTWNNPLAGKAVFN